jgi:hypothetical protein
MSLEQQQKELIQLVEKDMKVIKKKVQKKHKKKQLEKLERLNECDREKEEQFIKIKEERHKKLLEETKQLVAKNENAEGRGMTKCNHCGIKIENDEAEFNLYWNKFSTGYVKEDYHWMWAEDVNDENTAWHSKTYHFVDGVYAARDFVNPDQKTKNQPTLDLNFNVKDFKNYVDTSNANHYSNEANASCINMFHELTDKEPAFGVGADLFYYTVTQTLGKVIGWYDDWGSDATWTIGHFNSIVEPNSVITHCDGVLLPNEVEIPQFGGSATYNQVISRANIYNGGGITYTTNVAQGETPSPYAGDLKDALTGIAKLMISIGVELSGTTGPIGGILGALVVVIAGILAYFIGHNGDDFPLEVQRITVTPGACASFLANNWNGIQFLRRTCKYIEYEERAIGWKQASAGDRYNCEHYCVPLTFVDGRGDDNQPGAACMYTYSFDIEGPFYLSGKKIPDDEFEELVNSHRPKDCKLAPFKLSDLVKK